MKKLFLLLIPFLFVSCLPQPEETKDWDKENLSHKNNAEFTVTRTTNESGTYLKTGFERKSGDKGIVGQFLSVTLDTSNLYSQYQNKEEYTFNDDGTYIWTIFIKSGNTISKNFKGQGKYRLFKYSDEYFIFDLNGYGMKFYKVSDSGLQVIDYLTDESGNRIYAEPYLNSLQ